jgi:hypothetical protein
MTAHDVTIYVCGEDMVYWGPPIAMAYDGIGEGEGGMGNRLMGRHDAAGVLVHDMAYYVGGSGCCCGGRRVAANVVCMVATDRVNSWTTAAKDSSVRGGGGVVDEDVAGLGTDCVEIGSMAEEAGGWMVVDGGPDISDIRQGGGCVGYRATARVRGALQYRRCYSAAGLFTRWGLRGLQGDG